MLRVILGFLMAFGGAGGIENSATDAELAAATFVALLGVTSLYFGIERLKQQGRM